MAAPSLVELRPQPRQELFLACPADIAIYGGAAGGGKTWSALIEPLRHVNNPQFGAVVFRRTIPEVIHEGGLWDEAGQIYPLLGGTANQNEHQYTFPSGSRVTFAHMQREDDKYAWKSAQIPLIIFDQLETFSRTQFLYMLSRNRSTCGVKPYVRGTVNPEPGWLAEMLDWWIAEDGYADLERSGKIRWLANIDDTFQWADTPGELKAKFPGCEPKSVCFILSTIYDNQILLQKDPGYLANLKNLPLIDRERLLGDPERGGNWKVKPTSGKVFNRAWFKLVTAVPAGGRVVRFFDFAATEEQLTRKINGTPDPDYTASVLMLEAGGAFYILDATNERVGPALLDRYRENIARQDAARFAREGRRYALRWEREGGSSGKMESYRMVRQMAGIDAKGVPSQADKLMRAKPLAAQCEAGNVYLVEGAWNEGFLIHMHAQPDYPHDDLMDAASGAFNELTGRSVTREATSYNWVGG